MKVNLDNYNDAGWINLIPETEAEIYQLEALLPIFQKANIDCFEQRQWSIQSLGIYTRKLK